MRYNTPVVYVKNCDKQGVMLSSSPDIPEKELRERAATVLTLAAEEARRLGHEYIGTEHLVHCYQ